VLDARPVSGRLRTSLFSVLAPRLEGARVLDLFAGTGAMGLEALSRGAAHATFVERDPRAAHALEAWLRDARAEDCARVLHADALRGGPWRGPFDVAFVDPPFAAWDEHAGALLDRATGSLAEDGVAVLKIPASLALPDDPRWREERRKAVGSAAWALVARTPQPGTPVKG
jgi:16S rRNA (guanine966-N2)-methyltransferase